MTKHADDGAPNTDRPLAMIGVRGLDEILGGGLPRDRLYLLDGEPGAGKTTMALQFLMEGRNHGEQGLYVTLSETADELNAVRGVRTGGRWTASRSSSWRRSKAKRPTRRTRSFTRRRSSSSKRSKACWRRSRNTVRGASCSIR